jgi:NitT/TauT family transport system substrate-binding protein
MVRSSVSRFGFLAASGAAAALPALGIPAYAESNLTVMLMGGVPTDDMVHVFWALKQGLYEKAGIDLRYTPTSSGTAATTAVVAGANQVGKGSLLSTLNAHIKKLPIVVLANGSIWNPKIEFNALVTAADQPYKTGSDLNGSTIGVPALNDLNGLVISAWVDQHGGDSKTLKFVEVPNSAIQAALLEHRVAAAALQQPELTAALESGKMRKLGLPYSAVSDNFVFGSFFANADWAAKNPAAAKAFAKVTLEAAAYTNTHHKETEQLMADESKLPIETIHKMARVEAATKNDPQLIQPLIDAAAKYHFIPAAFPAKDLYS